MNARKIAFAAVFVMLVAVPFALAQEQEKNPLEGMSWMIGGRWKSGSSNVQEFEWGLDRLTVKARSYAVSDGKRRLVSEGMWYWDPGDKIVRGIFTASGMPFYMIQSVTRFEKRKVVHSFRTFSKGGATAEYTETLEPIGENEYRWKLYQGSGISEKALMEDTIAREIQR